MTDITRRGALFTGISLMGVAAAACSRESVDFPVEFKHGVASGDPGADRMVIWTRISAETAPKDNMGNMDNMGDVKAVSMPPIPVIWEMAADRDFNKIKRKGKTTTDASRDYTVKIDATGLKPGQTYYYRFKVGQYVSPIGRTKTLPAGNVNTARFAVVSCSNYPFGYFNVYDHIAKNDDFDAVLHLGDYFYEYGKDGYGGKTGAKLGRVHNPPHETLSLADYRTRHAQYKSDSASQAVHAAHAFICIWDDHETANNSWKGGAQNHNAGEGDWDTRRAAAMQAYYEYMPIRDPEPGRAREALFRSYSFGDLLTLISIETRLTARSEPLDYADHMEQLQTREGVKNFVQNILGAKNRELLGGVQTDYIETALKASKAKKQPWRVMANQIIMARVATANLTPFKDAEFIDEIEKLFTSIRAYIALSPLGFPRYLDAWDGFPAARERFYDMVQKAGVRDLLVLAGDTHECWANKLVTAAGVDMGVEIGTAAVTSPGIEAYFGDAAPEFSRLMNEKNDDVLYHNIGNRGYIDLTLNRKSAQANFISIDTVYKTDYKAFTSKSFKIEKADGSLKLRDS